ncbi:MAG: DUF2029 domain-containing protein [Salaquimonas sp.]|nr:DUF2029 domain-containing protein [Salaquimonas sp.]
MAEDGLEKNRALISGLNPVMMGLSVFVAVFVLYGSHLAGGYVIDGQGFILGRDFLNFWHYGLAAWGEAPARFYDLSLYNDVLDRLIPGYDYPDQNWSYPPHYLLVAAPFGLIGYNWALALFTALGVALYWKVVVSDHEGVEQRIALFAMPTFTVFLLCGQVSALLAVILVAIYRLMDRRPIITGLLIALLTVKPQIGLLIPLFLIFTGRSRVFFAAVAGTIAFFGLSVAIHGWEIWRVYLTESIAVQSTTLTQSNFVVMGLMPTVFVDMIMIGAGKQAAMAAQIVVALGAVALLWRVTRLTTDPFLQFAALLSASFVFTPYLMSYDTLVLGWVLLGLAVRAEMTGWQGIVYGLTMVICPLGVILSAFSIPGTPLVLIGLCLWVWKVARENAGVSRAVRLNRATVP